MGKRGTEIRPGDGHARHVALKGVPLVKSDRVPIPEGEINSANLSPLGTYLKINGLSTRSMARALGVSHRAVETWVAGKNVPSLAAAYEIERVSKGVVPMESWLGMPQARAQIASWREHQPEDIAERPSELPAGGFAAPLELRRKGGKRKKTRSVAEDMDFADES